MSLEQSGEKRTSDSSTLDIRRGGSELLHPLPGSQKALTMLPSVHLEYLKERIEEIHVPTPGLYTWIACAISIGIPCILSAIAQCLAAENPPTWPGFLFGVAGIGSFVAAIILGKWWMDQKSLMDTGKEKAVKQIEKIFQMYPRRGHGALDEAAWLVSQRILNGEEIDLRVREPEG